MKFFKFLEANCLAISLFIFFLFFFPIILFIGCLSVIGSPFLFMGDPEDHLSFEEYYQDSQLEAQNVVGVWMDDNITTSATVRFEEDNTVVMTAKDYILEYYLRIKTLEGSEDGFLEPRKIVQGLVKNWASKDEFYEVTGVYEIRIEGDKVKSVDVDWTSVNGHSVPDEQIKLTTTFDACYASGEERDALQMWGSYEHNCRIFRKEP